MRRIRRVLLATVAVAVFGLAAVPAVLADGIPEPLPGATGGPEPAAFLALVKGYGLTCQPDQGTTGLAEEHYDEVRHWFRIDRLAASGGRLADFWGTPLGVASFVVLAGLIYAFLDPTIRPDVAGLGEVAGLIVGLVIVTLAAAVPAWLTRRSTTGGVRLRALPATLLVGLACVVISRLTDFQPGYLYGVILGLEFARPLETRDTARLNAVAAALGLAIALVAWIGLGAVPTAETGFLAVALETALAAVLVAGLEGVVFGLLPLRFLPGEPLFRTSRATWAVLLGLGAFAFFHILLNPTSGYLADSSRTPLLTIVALLVGFGVVSVAFWGYFRYRPARD